MAMVAKGVMAMAIRVAAGDVAAPGSEASDAAANDAANGADGTSAGSGGHVHACVRGGGSCAVGDAEYVACADGHAARGSH